MARWSVRTFCDETGLSKKEFNRLYREYVRRKASGEAFQRFCDAAGLGAGDHSQIQRQLESRHGQAVGRWGRRVRRGGDGDNTSRPDRRARLRSRRSGQRLRQALQAPAPRQGQSRGGTASVSPPRLEGPAVQQIVWAAYPDNPRERVPLLESKTLSLEINSVQMKLPGGIPWLDLERLEALAGQFPSFVQVKKGDVRIHQGLATALKLESVSNATVELGTWAQLQLMLKASGKSQPALDTREGSLLFILHCTTARPPDLLEVCRELDAREGCLTLPSYAELVWQEGKLGDIEAFDEIARRSNKWRPQTCVGRGDCTLRDAVSVAKRSGSGGGECVRIVTESDRGELQCSTAKQHGSTKAPRDGQRWFHQEYVPGLSAREFRVWVVTRADDRALRGRRAQVVAKVVTNWDWDEAMHSTAVTDIHLKGCFGVTEAMLDEYALHIVDELRRRDDAKEHFASLEIACRVDIGTIAGTLFVVEATRFYNAHFFSLCLPEPYTMLVERIGDAVAEYFGVAK